MGQVRYTVERCDGTKVEWAIRVDVDNGMVEHQLERGGVWFTLTPETARKVGQRLIHRCRKAETMAI